MPHCDTFVSVTEFTYDMMCWLNDSDIDWDRTHDRDKSSSDPYKVYLHDKDRSFFILKFGEYVVSSSKLMSFTQGSKSGDSVANAFATGFGTDIRHIGEYLNDKRVIENSEGVFIWGILRGMETVLMDCIKNGHLFYYGDNSYLGPSKSYIRLTKRAIQTRDLIERPDDRLQKLINQHNLEIKDWTNSGKHILVCPPTDVFQMFYKRENWLEQTIDILKKHTDREIRIRRKPTEMNVEQVDGIYQNMGPRNTGFSSNPLEEDLKDCWAVVTMNSNVAVEAICHGIPAYVGTMSCASYMGNVLTHRIEYPIREDIHSWLSHLAYSQFTLEEIKNGYAKEILN